MFILNNILNTIQLSVLSLHAYNIMYLIIVFIFRIINPMNFVLSSDEAYE